MSFSIPVLDPDCTAILLSAVDLADAKHSKLLQIQPGNSLRIGRANTNKVVALVSNGFFVAPVLSRHHGEIRVSTDGKVFIRDVGSSNGTFVNSKRLSSDNIPSDEVQLFHNDKLELGVNIFDSNEDKISYSRVSLHVRILPHGADTCARKRFLEAIDETFANLKVSSPKSRSSSNIASQKSLGDQVQQQLCKNKQLSKELESLRREISALCESRPSAVSVQRIRSHVASLEREQSIARQQIESLLACVSESRSQEEFGLAQQLRALSNENQHLTADVSKLQSRLQAYEVPASRRSPPKTSSGLSGFLLFLSFVSVVFSVLYFICNNSDVEKSVINFFIDFVGIDLTSFFILLKSKSSALYAEALSVATSIKESLLPTPLEANEL